MTKQKECVSFDVPLELTEQRMMGVTSLEVYKKVYVNGSMTRTNKLLFLKHLISYPVLSLFTWV